MNDNATPSPGKPNETWFIEQFLRGHLPPEIQNQFSERMSADPAFEQRVMAQWLVLEYFDYQRDVTALHNELEPIVVAAGQRKRLYNSYNGVSFLIQVVGIAAVLVLCIGLGFLTYRYNQPLTKQVSTVPVRVDDPDDYGFSDGDDSVVVVQYNRSPGFWNADDTYTWNADTLTVYGPLLGRSATKNWQLSPADRRHLYWLKADSKTYLLLNKQTTLAPLQPNDSQKN